MRTLRLAGALRSRQGRVIGRAAMVIGAAAGLALAGGNAAGAALHPPLAGIARATEGAVRLPLTAAVTTPVVRVSVASDGSQAIGNSDTPALSDSGRFAAFESDASNLVPGDTNNSRDIFVHDTQTGTTSRVSVASDGTQATSYSSTPVLSGDGRYVAFESDASNLVPGDTNNSRDIFVHDTQTGTTSRADVASDGTQASTSTDLYGTASPAISGDGRYVAFWSWATNLVPGDTNGYPDVFVHDMQTGTTVRVSVASNGTQANGASDNETSALSSDGRYVVFESDASNLVPGDTNNAGDIFVHDMQTGTTVRVSVASNGTQANSYSTWPAISGNGRYVAFESAASNLVPGDTNKANDIFVHDMQTGTTVRVSVASNGTQGNAGKPYGYGSEFPVISDDGRYIAFTSESTNLVPGDTNKIADVFVHDMQTGTTSRVNVTSSGAQSNGDIGAVAALSGGGGYVSFSSDAPNLVPGDTNNDLDVFLRGLQP